MTRHTFFAAMLVALFSTAAFAQYIITGNPTDGFTAAKDGETVGTADQPINTVITAIQTDANGADVSIQFGDGENVLDIGAVSARFTGTWGKVTLSGKITSSLLSESGTVNIGTGVSVESTADISGHLSGGPAGYGIGNRGTLSITGGTVYRVYNYEATVSISGGTVSSNLSSSYYHDCAVFSFRGKITVSGNATITARITAGYGSNFPSTIWGNGSEIEILGGTVENTGDYEYSYAVNGSSIVLKGSPKITGRVYGSTIVLEGSPQITGNIRVAAKLSVTNAFAPGTETYYITLDGTVATGDVAVVGGANYINNFKLANLGWGLEADGDNLVTTEIPTYTVTFVDWNGTTLIVDWNGTKLRTQEVNPGFPATAPTPTRTGYTFTGWDIDFSNVTSDLTVTAEYVINTYTVTFLDWDGTVLKTETVEHGSAATPPTPTREGYALIGWRFDGSDWNVTDFTVTIDFTVTARYIATYTVTFLDWNGTVLKTETVQHGSHVAAPATPAREGYNFTGWDVEFNNGNNWIVTSNLTTTAEYAIATYNVTFFDLNDGLNGNVTETVEHGSAVTVPTATPQVGYTFIGWKVSYYDDNGAYFETTDYDAILSNVTRYLNVRAEYAINTYTVTFLDWDGTVLETQSVIYGYNATAPTVPARENYTFIGWDNDLLRPTSDLTVTALYAINTYTVTFFAGITELKTQTVEHGSAAIAPPVPEIAGYTFIGWNAEFNNVTSDLWIKALYEEITPILSQIATSNRLITPTQNGITLTAKTTTTVAVYNLSGKLINRQNYNAGSHSISLGHLPKGMYIVKASHGSEKEILRVQVR